MKVDELQRYDLDLNGMVVPCEGGRFISASEAKAIEDERDKALEYKEAYHEKVLMLENDIALAWEERDRLKAERDAWHSVFGTSQLTHAQSRLEEAEKRVQRQAEEIERLRKTIEDIKTDSGNRPGHEKWEYYCLRLHSICVVADKALKTKTEAKLPIPNCKDWEETEVKDQNEKYADEGPGLTEEGEMMKEDDAEEMRGLEEDVIILALRLYGEDKDTFSPECREVMNKYRGVVEERLRGHES